MEEEIYILENTRLNEKQKTQQPTQGASTRTTITSLIKDLLSGEGKSEIVNVSLNLLLQPARTISLCVRRLLDCAPYKYSTSKTESFLHHGIDHSWNLFRRLLLSSQKCCLSERAEWPGAPETFVQSCPGRPPQNYIP
jgi:hypothetical protein